MTGNELGYLPSDLRLLDFTSKYTLCTSTKRSFPTIDLPLFPSLTPTTYKVSADYRTHHAGPVRSGPAKQKRSLLLHILRYFEPDCRGGSPLFLFLVTTHVCVYGGKWRRVKESGGERRRVEERGGEWRRVEESGVSRGDGDEREVTWSPPPCLTRAKEKRTGREECALCRQTHDDVIISWYLLVTKDSASRPPENGDDENVIKVDDR